MILAILSGQKLIGEIPYMIVSSTRKNRVVTSNLTLTYVNRLLVEGDRSQRKLGGVSPPSTRK